MKMRRIGIFGGSFNPVHIGHVALARQIQQAAQLDEVWLMVSPQNPLKQASSLLNDRTRYALAAIALRGDERVKASDYELRLPKPSYTWNTLQHLKQDHPDCSFILIIGGDNWELFQRWYRADDIIAEFPIVVYPRRGSNLSEESLPQSVTVVETEFIDVSSTMVRQMAAREEEIATLVPAPIAPLVKRLYR